MTNEEIVKALRCILTEGNVAPDCKGCPFYKREQLDPETAEKLGIIGEGEWYYCDCNAVGFAAADLIENQQNRIRALLQANDALRQRWIPVTERLPEGPGHYLICTSINYWHGGCLDANEGRKYFEHCGTPMGYEGTTKSAIESYYDVTGRWNSACDSTVTHWMPLPDAPEVK